MNRKKLYRSIISNSVIAFFTFFLILSSISFLYLTEVYEDKKKVNNVISETIAENINSSLIKRIHVLDMIHYFKITHLDDEPAVNNYLKESTNHEITGLHTHIEDEFFTSVEIINNVGKVINSSNDFTLGFSYSEKKFYTALKDSNKSIYWSSPSISTTTTNLSTSITKKYVVNGKEYLIIGYFDLEDLNSSAIETSDKGINISLIDAYGKYIFDSNPENVDYQKYYENFDGLIESIDQEDPYEWYNPFRKDGKIISVTDLKHSLGHEEIQENVVPNWYIIVSQSSESAIGYLIRIFLMSLMIMGLGFILSSLNSYYFAKRIDHFLESFNEQISLAISNDYNFALKNIKYERFKVTADNFKALMNHVKKQKQALSNLAYKDQLTNLYNRYYLIDFLEERIASNEKTSITLIHLDFKDFKWINDTYNHSVGDQSIQIFAEKLIELISDHHLIARLSGDEFGIVFLESIHEEDMYQKFETFTREIKSEFHIGQTLIQREYRCGVSIYPESAKSQYELMKFSDIALEASKKETTDIFTYYNEEMKSKLERKNNLIKEVNIAYTHNNFILYYQPFVSLENNEIIGFEVLLRLNDSNNEIISPYYFIPILEENGLIIDVGYWIIEESFNKLKFLEQKFNRRFKLSINVSPIQLKSPHFIKRVKEIMEITKINPNTIDFEITEGILIDSYTRTQSTLIGLQKLGFNISLDDFGTGYSSLSYLSNLPLNTLKIDRSFMKNLHEEKQQQLFKSIISIANNLNLEVISEGIETEEQLSFVKSFNCPIGQGYYWAKPQPFEHFGKLLENQKKL